MNLKALLDYARGLEMSEKQAKGIEEQEKLAKISDIQTVKEGKRPPERNVTGVEKITLTKDDLAQH